MEIEEPENATTSIPREEVAEEALDSSWGVGVSGFSSKSLRRLCQKALPQNSRISPDCIPALAAMTEEEVGEILRLGLARSKRKTLFAEDLAVGLAAYHHKHTLNILGPQIADLRRDIERLNHILELGGNYNGRQDNVKDSSTAGKTKDA